MSRWRTAALLVACASASTAAQAPRPSADQASERRLVQAEAERLRASIGRDDHAQRVELARWMAAHGLEDDAIRELDRVFAADRENAAALQMIREVPLALDLPAADPANPASVLTETIKSGARSSPARAEIAVQRIADLARERRVDLHRLVAAELAAPQPTRRAFATLCARRALQNDLLPELCSRAILDPMPDVRVGAVAALAGSSDPGVIAPAVRALGSTYATVRANAAEALGGIGRPAAVAPLIGHLASLQGSGPATGVRGTLSVTLQTSIVSDYDVELAQSASIGDPIVTVQESGVVHDVRAQAQITRVIEIQTTVAALEQLTGLRKSSPKAWLEWWSEAEKTWPSSTSGAEPRKPVTPR